MARRFRTGRAGSGDRAPTEEFISLREAATLYHVSIDTLRRRISEGRLPAVKAGHRLIRVRPSDLERVFRPVPSAGTRIA